MNSVLQNLNDEEKDAIEELKLIFKNELPPMMSNDPTLYYRFLKARDFDVRKAEEMLRNNITWRKALQVDTILEWFEPHEVFNYLGMSSIGHDKQGNIVRYAPSGKIDITDLVKSMKMNDYMKHWIWMAETDSNNRVRNNNGQTDAYQAISIFNLEGFPFSNAIHKASGDFLVRMIHLLQDNYPERMKGLYIINAPMYYTVLYSIVKKIMSSAMVAKIHIYGHDGWEEDLLKIIDADVLPAFLGGNRTDPDGDPRCKSFIYHGGQVPSKYYLTDQERYFEDPSRVEKITIPHKEKHRISVEVTEVGSLIRWEFESKNKDIGFGLEYQSNDCKPKELLPMYKIVTSDGTEKGFFKCQKKGTYFVVFENSDSWWGSKEVHYCITVQPPN